MTLRTEPVDKELATFLKLFRKIKSAKIRKGLLSLLKGIVELENKQKK